MAYQDAAAGQPNSGHVAQIHVLKYGRRFVGVANTHLRWDAPGTLRDRQYGYRQITQLLKERSQKAPECSGWIICGDLNVTADSDVVAALRKAGFEFAHSDCSSSATCNPGGHAKMVDFVFHDRALTSEPLPLPPIGNDTPLPGPDQPSDHVAVLAALEWR